MLKYNKSSNLKLAVPILVQRPRQELALSLVRKVFLGIGPGRNLRMIMELDVEWRACILARECLEGPFPFSPNQVQAVCDTLFDIIRVTRLHGGQTSAEVMAQAPAIAAVLAAVHQGVMVPAVIPWVVEHLHPVMLVGFVEQLLLTSSGIPAYILHVLDKFAVVLVFAWKVHNSHPLLMRSVTTTHDVCFETSRHFLRIGGWLQQILVSEGGYSIQVVSVTRKVQNNSCNSIKHTHDTLHTSAVFCPKVK